MTEEPVNQSSDDPVVAALWAEFKRTRDTGVRDKLILQYSPLVKYVAGRMNAEMASSAQAADLVSYGMLGLIEATDKFDPDYGVRFTSYAIPRIQGSIIDEIRSFDWVPRGVRAASRKLRVAQDALEEVLNRPPTDAELAEQLGVDEAGLADIEARAAKVSLVAFDGPVSNSTDGDESLSLSDVLADLRVPDPHESAETDERHAALVKVLESLGDQQRAVIVLYYLEGLTLAQIGEVLQVTESRVSRIHARAVAILKERLSAVGEHP